MQVQFISGSDKGGAKYDPATDEYSWYYDGDDSRIQDLLSELDDGRVYTKIATDGTGNLDGEQIVHRESFPLMSWDEHIERLAMILRKNGFEILYLGPVDG